MHVDSIGLTDIRCFRRCFLDLGADREDLAGWITVVGGNGDGKSTILQSLSLALLGPSAATPLAGDVSRWVSEGADYGVVQVGIRKGPNDVAIGYPKRAPYVATLGFPTSNAVVRDADGLTLRADRAVEEVAFDAQLTLMSDHDGLRKGPYSPRDGWFSCAYGPYRRLWGGSGDGIRDIHGPRTMRHATLFSEELGLPHVIDWVVNLNLRANDETNELQPRHELERNIVQALITRALPDEIALDEITSTSIYFKSDGKRRAVNELSDGYRSYIAFVIDITRSLLGCFQNTKSLQEAFSEMQAVGTLQIEGVVLIDEIDAHLHPAWQRTIAKSLTEAFPRVQFIVTTHSPFVVQDATPGSVYVIRSSADGNTVERLETGFKSWPAEDVLVSDVFGLSSTQDEDIESLMVEVEELSRTLGVDRHQSPVYRDKIGRLRGFLRESPAVGPGMNAVDGLGKAEPIDEDFLSRWHDAEDR